MKNYWKEYVANENIPIWKLTKLEGLTYAVKGYILKGNFYFIDDYNEESFTYRSESIFVENVGKFEFNKEKDMYEFIEVNKTVFPFIPEKTNIVYEKNKLSTDNDNGLWSYAKEWQVLWFFHHVINKKKCDNLPKKYLFGDKIIQFN